MKRSIQSERSTNCITEVPLSKPEISGSVTAKLISAAVSAAQRTVPARVSRPNASNSTPNRIGSQIDKLRKPMFFFFPRVGCYRPAEPIRNGHSCQVINPITPTIITSA